MAKLKKAEPDQPAYGTKGRMPPKAPKYKNHPCAMQPCKKTTAYMRREPKNPNADKNEMAHYCVAHFEQVTKQKHRSAAKAVQKVKAQAEKPKPLKKTLKKRKG